MNMLQVQIGGLTWPTPLGLASGTCGWGEELDGLIDWGSVGAIFTKGLSLRPRQGHPPPRIWETASGMLNAIGLENVGFESFVAEKMPFLRRFRASGGGRVFVNLFGTTVEECGELAAGLDGVEGVDGVEINLSCPNVKAGGIEFGRSPEGAARVTKAVRQATKKFIAVKLSPSGRPVEVARACVDSGAQAVCMGNTMPAMAIDIEKRLPRLSAVGGGLSGPALKPVALRQVYELAKSVAVPIIGIGGITTGADVVEFLLAGASAVQIGTATFSQPNAVQGARDELLAYLARHQETAVQAVVGGLRAVG